MTKERGLGMASVETNDERQLLESVGAVLEGHFLLSSGKHSGVYIEKFRLVERPEVTVRLCERIVERYRAEGVQTVAGPTTAGAILAFEVGRQLGARAIVAERSADGGREFRRGFRIEPGERVLVVDDVLTTGGSVRSTVEAARALGAEVVGAVVLIDRSGGRGDAGAPYWAVIEVDEPAYDPEECPLCARGVPIVKPGSSLR